MTKPLNNFGGLLSFIKSLKIFEFIISLFLTISVIMRLIFLKGYDFSLIAAVSFLLFSLYMYLAYNVMANIDKQKSTTPNQMVTLFFRAMVTLNAYFLCEMMFNSAPFAYIEHFLLIAYYIILSYYYRSSARVKEYYGTNADNWL